MFEAEKADRVLDMFFTRLRESLNGSQSSKGYLPISSAAPFSRNNKTELTIPILRCIHMICLVLHKIGIISFMHQSVAQGPRDRFD